MNPLCMKRHSYILLVFVDELIYLAENSSAYRSNYCYFVSIFSRSQINKKTEGVFGWIVFATADTTNNTVIIFVFVIVLIHTMIANANNGVCEMYVTLTLTH